MNTIDIAICRVYNINIQQNIVVILIFDEC